MESKDDEADEDGQIAKDIYTFSSSFTTISTRRRRRRRKEPSTTMTKYLSSIVEPTFYRYACVFYTFLAFYRSKIRDKLTRLQQQQQQVNPLPPACLPACFVFFLQNAPSPSPYHTHHPSKPQHRRSIAYQLNISIIFGRNKKTI